jgi:D-alanyl-lipoteichoic acid acyltransferase DltB (MBOAT superfamily)
MLFNSLGFLVFLIVVLVLYHVKWIPWIHKKAMVLIASYLFYGLWNPPLVLLLWISTAVDWAAGNQLSREENPRKRKLWLMLSMGFNLGFLGFFKYGDFFLENLSPCSTCWAWISRQDPWILSYRWVFLFTPFRPCPIPSIFISVKIHRPGPSWTLPCMSLSFLNWWRDLSFGLRTW